MSHTIIKAGDFCAVVAGHDQRDTSLADWAAQWNSGVVAQVVNPFYVDRYTSVTSFVEIPPSDDRRPSS